ncbi:DUF481 domain-containing protein [Aquiflexum gelatinilyticum]|uniref:DUF481 domain-containing protein n=1 Tax=Aquiflexum gelatinilyticum TaxID=2961943 RepID=A0A9X2P3G7_9BACT|nr:DUF481 domain-containing protein [Aquiflexum gelatinilyticum]MCR9013936.1 DUF481 domain-containing protein [Aquiflexum gelatinilyticum]
MIMRTWFLFLILFCCFVNISKAQLDESDSAKNQVRLVLNGNRQKGNVNIAMVRGRMDFLFRINPDFIFKTQNSLLYQEFFEKKADRDIFSRNYLYFKPQNRFYPYAIGYVSTNFRRRIDHRYFAGIGVTWQMILTGLHSVKLSTNTIYESTVFDSQVFNFPEFDGKDNIRLWRQSIYLRGIHRIFEKKLTVFYDAFWQPHLLRTKNFRYQANIGLDFPVWKGFNLNVNYLLGFENVVAEKVLQRDSIFSFGLSYQIKKL